MTMTRIKLVTLIEKWRNLIVVRGKVKEKGLLSKRRKEIDVFIVFFYYSLIDSLI